MKKTNNKNHFTFIKDVYAFKQYDSQGLPTIGVLLSSNHNVVVKSIIPSISWSTKKEASTFYDQKNAFEGKIIDKTIKIINSLIRQKMIGMNPFDQKQIDELLMSLYKTINKSVLQTNFIFIISVATCKLAAKTMNVPLYQYIAKSIYKMNNEFKLPNIMVNVISGGINAYNAIDFQGFMFVPLKYKSIDDACNMVSQCFHELGKILRKKKILITKVNNGGYEASNQSIYEVLDLMEKAMMNCHLKSGRDIAIAIDVAANYFYTNGTYFLKRAFFNKELSKVEATKNRNQMIELYLDLIKYYPIISIEEPLYKNDWLGFKQLTYKLQKQKIMVIAGDMYGTNKKNIERGVIQNTSNAAIIKLNQFSTITKAIEIIKLAQRAKFKTVISYFCNADNEDTFIVDLAVGVNADYLKSGGFDRSENITKFNRLIEIEKTIDNKHKIFI